MSVYEQQQARARATEERILQTGWPTWNAATVRRQNRTTAEPGRVISRPFSRLDAIERAVKAKRP